MKVARFAALLAALTLLTDVAAYTQDSKIALKLNLKEGQTLKQRTTGSHTVSLQIGNKPQVITEKIVMDNTYQVQKVDSNGTATVKVTLDAINYRRDDATGVTSCDSHNRSAAIDPLSKAIVGFAGQSYTISISPEGNVSDMQGADQLVEQAVANMGSVSELVKSMAKTLLEQHFGSQAILESNVSKFNIYPDAPVAMEERWSKSFSVSSGLPISADMFLKIIERSGGVSKVKMYLAIKPNANANTTQFGAFHAKVALSGKQEGILDVDEATGWVKSARLSTDVSGNVMPIGVQDAEAIPITIKGTTTIDTL